jgi:LysM repeat protein
VPIAEPMSHPRLYTARSGDTLVTISDRFGVSLTQLRRWNKITGTKVSSGQRLYVADPATIHHSATRAHRGTGAQASPNTHHAAPSKSAVNKPAPPAAPKRNSVLAANKAPVKHPAPAHAAKKTGTANARKSPVKKSAAVPNPHPAK